jgi:dephospho-CoA kinase
VLRVGLTGGIGSGKSTVAHRLAALGAVLVDADVLAREVVAPGTDGLAEVVAAFGSGVLDADGALDRAALAAVVFDDAAARERLNAVVHPRVRERADELVAAAPPDAVVVQDVPLLVETGSPAAFALVVVVHADVPERVRRLVNTRGLAAADARARIAAQADDVARRAAADVWLDNDGIPEQLQAAVDALWRDRLVPFEANLRGRRPVPPPDSGSVRADPRWAADGARLAARVSRAAGHPAAHVGPTAVPGLPADDLVDLQVGVDLADLDAVAAARAGLDAAGFPRLPRDDTSGEWRHGGADPGRPVRVHVRGAGSPAWRAALLRRDWLRADATARAEYARLAPGEQEWWDGTVTRADDWAASSGWTLSASEVVAARPHGR